MAAYTAGVAALPMPSATVDGAELARGAVIAPPEGFTDSLPYHLGGMVIRPEVAAPVAVVRDPVLESMELEWLDAYKAAAKAAPTLDTADDTPLLALHVGMLFVVAGLGVRLASRPGTLPA